VLRPTVDDLCVAWLWSTSEVREERNLQVMFDYEEKAMLAGVKVLAAELGLLQKAHMDLDEFLFQVLMRASSYCIVATASQLHTVLRVAMRNNKRALHQLQVGLEAMESKRQGIQTFRHIVRRFCHLLWESAGLAARDQVAPGCRIEGADNLPLGDEDQFTEEVVDVLQMSTDRPWSISDFMACCVGRPKREVKLYMYDISHGSAKAISDFLPISKWEGVWHSGLVVYGREYFFNGDLVFKLPGETVWGDPTKELMLGFTLRRMEELHKWVCEELKPVFHVDSYDTFENNCNHFTDRMSDWLCGDARIEIPEEVVNQKHKLEQMPAIFHLLKPLIALPANSVKCTQPYIDKLRRSRQMASAGAADLRQNGLDCKRVTGVFNIQECISEATQPLRLRSCCADDLEGAGSEPASGNLRSI